MTKDRRNLIAAAHIRMAKSGRPFAQVPSDVIRFASPSALQVFSVIALEHRKNIGRNVAIGRVYISQFLGVDRHTVQKSIQELLNLGCIKESTNSYGEDVFALNFSLYDVGGGGKNEET